jgi:hypothetical protein
METLFSVVLSALFTFGTPSQKILNDQGQDQLGSKIDWNCEAPTWVGSPGVDQGYFKGTLKTNCQFTAINGAGFENLRTYLMKKVTTAPEVIKIHSGPTDETYLNMPSVKYDVTVAAARGDDALTVRQDAHLASDLLTRMVLDTVSTKTEGTGYGQYVKRLNMGLDVGATKSATLYTAVLSTRTVVEKPRYAPTGMFESKVKEAMINKMVEAGEVVSIELAQQL